MRLIDAGSCRPIRSEAAAKQVQPGNACLLKAATACSAVALHNDLPGICSLQRNDINQPSRHRRNGFFCLCGNPNIRTAIGSMRSCRFVTPFAHAQEKSNDSGAGRSFVHTNLRPGPRDTFIGAGRCYKLMKADKDCRKRDTLFAPGPRCDGCKRDLRRGKIGFVA